MTDLTTTASHPIIPAVAPAQISLEIRSGETSLQIRIDGKPGDVQAIVAGLAKLCGGQVVSTVPALPDRPWVQVLALCGSEPDEETRRAVAKYQQIEALMDQDSSNRRRGGQLVFDDADDLQQFAADRVALLQAKRRCMQRVLRWIDGLETDPMHAWGRAECTRAIASELNRNSKAEARISRLTGFCG